MIDNSTSPQPGELFFNTYVLLDLSALYVPYTYQVESSGSLEETGSIALEGGKSYELLVRYQYVAAGGQSAGSLAPDHRGGVRFGVAPLKTAEEFINEAVEVAKSVDAIVRGHY